MPADGRDKEDENQCDRAELKRFGKRVVFEQFGDDEHRETVKKSDAMSNIYINRRGVPGARHHLLVFDNADEHSRQKKKTGRQKTDFNGDIHLKTPQDRFYKRKRAVD